MAPQRNITAKGSFTALDNRNMTLLVVAGVLFIVYCFVFGDSGLIERILLHRYQERAVVRINALQAENSELMGVLRSYQGGNYRKEDFLRSGYLSGNEKVFVFSGIDTETRTGISETRDTGMNFTELTYVRILWIIASIVTVLVFTIKRSRSLSDRP